jgi:hypothetical protein
MYRPYERPWKKSRKEKYQRKKINRDLLLPLKKVMLRHDNQKKRKKNSYTQ